MKTSGVYTQHAKILARDDYARGAPLPLANNARKYARMLARGFSEDFRWTWQSCKGALPLRQQMQLTAHVL